MLTMLLRKTSASGARVSQVNTSLRYIVLKYVALCCSRMISKTSYAMRQDSRTAKLTFKGLPSCSYVVVTGRNLIRINPSGEELISKKHMQIPKKYIIYPKRIGLTARCRK